MKLRILFLLFVSIEMVMLLKNPKTHRNWHLLNEDTCGESLSNRIIGGTKAEMGQFPWMAILGYINPQKNILKVTINDFKCGGVIINHLYVLTAAHCIRSNEYPTRILDLVRVGEFDRRTDIDCVDGTCMPPPQDFKPVKRYRHEKFDENEMHNDIGLIRLDRTIKYNDYVMPICVPYGKLMNKDNLPKSLFVAGWGKYDLTRNKMSDYLYYITVRLRSINDCKKVIPLYMLAEGQFCAGGKMGEDSCAGDSGGPLMATAAIDGSPRYFAVGIVSFGMTECGIDAPAIYTQVAYFLDWILDRLEP